MACCLVLAARTGGGGVRGPLPPAARTRARPAVVAASPPGSHPFATRQHTQSACAPAAQVFEVQDAAAHNIFCRCPAVTSALSVRFYAGVLLRTPDGTPLGTLCVLDVKPRVLSDSQRSVLVETSKKTMALLNARRHAAPSRAVPLDPEVGSTFGTEAFSVPSRTTTKAWLLFESPAGIALLLALVFVLAFMVF